jgi:initiation factor 1A
MSGRNPRGGKSFKKAAKKPMDGNLGKQERFDSLDDGQDYARVLVMLGNRRVRALCNDGVERVLKIRGRLCQRGRNKKIIRPGDLVIYSARDFGDASSSDDSDKDGGDGVCDLIDRVEPENYRQVRKEPGVNAILFQQDTGSAKGPPMPPSEDIFDDGTAPQKEEKEERIEVEMPDEELNIDAI